jgi:hypothetical protein
MDTEIKAKLLSEEMDLLALKVKHSGENIDRIIDELRERRRILETRSESLKRLENTWGGLMAKISEAKK